MFILNIKIFQNKLYLVLLQIRTINTKLHILLCVA
nr:MAG TPA: hypothetical protein [Bacteriophage sp.]